MRVLMLGWDFSPRISGGVGSACQDLAQALTRASESTQVLFVLPRLRGDEEPDKVRLLSGVEESPAAALPRPAPPPSSVAAVHEPAKSVKRAEPPPALPSAAEALRLLAIDSPLRPYLTPREYDEVVRKLLARIHAETPTVVHAPEPPFRVVRPSARRAPSNPDPAAPRSTPAASATAQARGVPYGRTLDAEVERYARTALAVVERETASGQGFDVIHAHDWMTFPAALLLRERTGKPLVVHFHSSEAERRGPLAAREVRAIEQAALDAAERVLCVSEASARALRSHYAVERAKVRVLHNAFSPLPAARRPESAGPVVLYLGRLSEQKSPDVFLQAAARVAARHPAARFVLAGEGELYPELKALAEELGLAGSVEFTGFVSGEELARTYAGADVYVLSSAAEPFGISVLEALSLGVPTIVPRGAGVTEVVSSVLRFAPGDAADLAEKIVGLLERPALRSQLSAAGLREVNKLRWDRPARALHGIYDEVAHGPPRP
jgi:glycosyltransferase involved in cell wall biosynthesis